MLIGILALQGAFKLHEDMFKNLGVQTRLVKKEIDLEDLDAIVIPGGESTVLNKHLDRSGLGKVLFQKISEGLFAFGTCAGLILLSQNKDILNCEVQRNAYGTQRDSFIAKVEILPTSQSCEVAFIRAPKIISISNGAQALVMLNDEIVGVSSDKAIAVSFHNEVTGDDAMHRFFVDTLTQRLA